MRRFLISSFVLLLLGYSVPLMAQVVDSRHSCLSLMEQFRLAELQAKTPSTAVGFDYYDVSSKMMGPVFDLSHPLGAYLEVRYIAFAKRFPAADKETYIRAIHRNICTKILVDSRSNPATPIEAPPRSVLDPMIQRIEEIMIRQN